jgi:lysophospholipase L1-like esterase
MDEGWLSNLVSEVGNETWRYCNNMNILFRGGSISAGMGLTKCYVDIVRDSFPACNIINKSYEGNTTFEGIRTFYQDIDPYKPDFLFIHFGIDDIFRPVYRSEFKENLVQLVRISKKRFDSKIFIVTSHTFENRFEMDAANIYYKTIREVAVDLKCIYVPIHLFWMSYLYETGRSCGDLIQADRRLPNEEGHEIFSSVIINRLKEYID